MEDQKRNGRVLTKFELDDIEYAAISPVQYTNIIFYCTLQSHAKLCKYINTELEF